MIVLNSHGFRENRLARPITSSFFLLCATSSYSPGGSDWNKWGLLFGQDWSSSKGLHCNLWLINNKLPPRQERGSFNQQLFCHHPTIFGVYICREVTSPRKGEPFSTYQFPEKRWSSDINSLFSRGPGSLKAGHHEDAEKETGSWHSPLLTATLHSAQGYRVKDGHCCSEASREAERKSSLLCQQTKMSRPCLPPLTIQSQWLPIFISPFVTHNPGVLKLRWTSE